MIRNELKEKDVWKVQVQELTKVKDDNQILKQIEKLITRNKEWKKNEEAWIKKKLEWEVDLEKMKRRDEDNLKTIEELKKKNEEKRQIIDQLKTRREAEKKALVEIERRDCEKLKNELAVVEKKYVDALNEIDKLARFVNIFGNGNNSEFGAKDVNLKMSRGLTSNFSL